MHQGNQKEMKGMHVNNAIQKIPNIMTINQVHFCVFWLNTTPVKTGILSVYSPREIICRQMVDAKKWFKLMFDDYF